MRATRWEDFILFARAQIASGDIDPTYPLLRSYYKAEQLDDETALWRTLLYVTWYHIGSAETAWKRYPKPGPLDGNVIMALPTGVERRGFRGASGCNLARAFVANVLKRAGSDGLWRWMKSCGTGEDGWRNVRQELEAVSGAGPWASFKWADLMRNVHGFCIEAPDIGVGGKGEMAGPIPGMVALTGRPWKECANDVGLQKELLARAVARGVPFGGLDEMETCLCDFNSMLKGGYYVGHDLDDQMTKLQGSTAGLWEARRCFDDKWRGELGQPTWFGVDKKRKTVYRDQGVILVR